MPAAKEQGVKEMRSESLLGASEKALVAHACFAVFIEAEMFGLLVLLLTAPSIVSIHHFRIFRFDRRATTARARASGSLFSSSVCSSTLPMTSETF